MDAHDILSEMLHTFNVNYGGALDAREAAALRAALTPWITWMARPAFNPLRDDQLEPLSKSHPVYQVFLQSLGELTRDEIADLKAFMHDSATPQQQVDSFDKWLQAKRHAGTLRDRP